METSEFKLIISIINKGKGEKVAEAAHRAGAEAGTILFGHGIAVPLLLGITIEPEKEVLLTIVEGSKVQSVLDVIVKEADLTQPNKGIAFVTSINQVVGMNTSEDNGGC